MCNNKICLKNKIFKNNCNYNNSNFNNKALFKMKIRKKLKKFNMKFEKF